MKIILKTVLLLLVFFVVLVFLIQTAPVQDFVRGKAVSWLEKKLNTHVEVGKIYIGFPNDVVIENVYLEDRNKDTLLSGGKIRINIALFKLFSNKVEISEVLLDHITAKVKRELPGTSFNFQFIIDAFSSKNNDSKPSTKDSASNFSLKSIILNKIRFVYKDTITGNDFESRIDHLETKISFLDPAKMRFDVTNFTIDGFDARVYQSRPLATSNTELKEGENEQAAIPLLLNCKELSLKKINLDYRNNVSAFYLKLDVQKLLVHPDKLDLSNHIIDLDDFILQDSRATIHLGSNTQAKIVEKETNKKVKTQAAAGWKLNIAALRLDSNHFQFDNDNQPAAKAGMDYAHLDAADLTLHLDHFFFSQDSISGKLNKGRVKEKSGFELQNLESDFSYSATGADLKNFYLKTPGTELRHNLGLHYASLSSLKNNPGNARLRIALEKSKVQLKDILVFAPSLRHHRAFTDPHSTIYIDSRIDGHLSDLRLEEFQLTGFNSTKINISGSLAGLPDSKNVRANLVIRNFQSSKKDLLLFVPASSLPSNISIPDVYQLTGTLAGGLDDLTAKLSMQTNMGNLRLDGRAKKITDKTSASYYADIETEGLQLGTILQKKDLVGAVSAAFKINGTGFDKRTMDATIDGVVHTAEIKQYNYRHLVLKGTIASQQVKIHAAIADPNIDAVADARADLSTTWPAIVLQARVDSIKTGPLHLSQQAIVYRGNIDADFPVTDPDSLNGKLYITQSLLVNDSQHIKMDTLAILAGKNDSGQYIHLKSDVLTASLRGHYKVTDLDRIFRNAIQPYFAGNSGNDNRVDANKFNPAIIGDKGSLATGKTMAGTPAPYDFTLNAELINRPVLKVLVKDLQRMDSITFTSHFSSQNGWNAYLAAPVIEIGDNHLLHLAVNAGTMAEGLKIRAAVQQFTRGASLALYNTTADALIKDDKINFDVKIKDRSAKEKYHLAGLFEKDRKDNYLFSLKPDSLLLNYETWMIAAGNRIEITKKTILARDFSLDKLREHLDINSDSTGVGSPLTVQFRDFKLETLTGFIQSDSTLVGGRLNGTADITSVLEQPAFTSDLRIDDLNIKKDTVGNVKMLLSTKMTGVYDADIAITGRGNNVTLQGNYHTGQGIDNFDLILNLKQLPLTTAQAFSNGAISQASGSMNGQFTVKGNFKQPVVNGDLNFVEAAFNPTRLNNRFLIDKEKIKVDAQGISFDQFSVRDSANNELVLNGRAATSNFTNYLFDFTVKANNFQALNSTKKDNKLFYGKLFFNSNLNVKGTELAPVIDGRITVNDKTRLTIVLPQKEPGIAAREGVVEFVDMDAPVNDSLFLKSFDSLNTFALKGIDVSANIEIKKEAELNLIVDEGSGDFLNVRGEASLTAGVDPGGKITLAGSYELEDGAYQLTFNLLRRKFNIQKGSKIIWGGEPTEADVNITAAYETNTAPFELVKNQLGPVSDNERNTYLQKLPFQVFLKMTGKLLQPLIKFDIVLPDDKEYNVSPVIVSTVRTRLELLRQEEGEMNKQVFALLLLNRFVGENPFNSSGNGATAQTLIRQSASKLLTEQLNRLAENLVQGVDLNFDVASSDDYTTGERKDRTDLNVGLSKRLLNDRLTVTVGSNFELQGVQNSNRNSNNIAGNVALNYRLSKDGRYVLRAYRKNEYQGVIDGYIIETGVGFIITVDYNRFKEIFQNKKTRQNSKTKDGQNEKSQTTPVSTTTPALP